MIATLPRELLTFWGTVPPSLLYNDQPIKSNYVIQYNLLSIVLFFLWYHVSRAALKDLRSLGLCFG